MHCHRNDRIRYVPSHTNGKSPFHPRSPPECTQSTWAGAKPTVEHAMSAISVTVAVVPGDHIERPEWIQHRVLGSDHRLNHIVRVDVGLRLGSVADHMHLRRVLAETTHEVGGHTMGLVRQNHVAESERTLREVEHEAVRGDQSLARELRRTVGRRSYQRTMVLLSLNSSEVAVHTTARGVEEPAGSQTPAWLRPLDW